MCHFSTNGKKSAILQTSKSVKEIVWELRIRDVKSSDEGLYECQMTTHPPVSIRFKLRVVVPSKIIATIRIFYI
ncbi:hypothetical protein Anas_08269 [Armadillidium nasatum]|uniref:Immunoglobulin V-set domain-containing protein n=1 Tax=Armadillidium nasatum TaxID=96803 RepID=A0A5N5TA00_9CRUS|nr:hypothetical protein Anas_08269 [Armadillidium nasatum]